MKTLILSFLLTIFQSSVSGQSNDTWTPFYNKDTTLVGYKDKNGVVKIEPKFQTGFYNASKFDHMIVVAEEVKKQWKISYLTKSGKLVGRDSVHMYDNAPDCESEGFIRFRDRKTDKVGIFNRKGDIVIPAEYSEMERVRNGMIMALKGGEKKYYEGGEHYSWIGGKEILIDTNNNILVDSFKYTVNINFHSLSISTKPNPDATRQNFRTTDGKYFSFIDFDKEFKAWLKTSLLANLTKEKLLQATYKEVIFSREPIGWTTETKNSFIDQNYELIKSKLLQLNSKDCDYSIFHDGLNPYIYDSDEYREYFNNCGEPKSWIYPTKTIVITYSDNGNSHQDHIEFLRTDNGYKLVSLKIGVGK